jgi:small subunit ribosomal protein S17
MAAERGNRKVLKGVVVSDKMQKTAVVSVERKFRHPVYKKVIRIRKKYKAHNEENKAHIGDSVEMMETKPMSREKRWRIIKIIKKAAITVETK